MHPPSQKPDKGPGRASMSRRETGGLDPPNSFVDPTKTLATCSSKGRGGQEHLLSFSGGIAWAWESVRTLEK